MNLHSLQIIKTSGTDPQMDGISTNRHFLKTWFSNFLAFLTIRRTIYFKNKTLKLIQILLNLTKGLWFLWTKKQFVLNLIGFQNKTNWDYFKGLFVTHVWHSYCFEYLRLDIISIIIEIDLKDLSVSTSASNLDKENKDLLNTCTSNTREKDNKNVAKHQICDKR